MLRKVLKPPMPQEIPTPPKNVLPTSNGVIADAFINLHPKPGKFKWIGCQIAVMVAFLGILALFLYPGALIIRHYENQAEMIRIFNVRQSTAELAKYRDKFGNQLVAIFNQTNPSQDDIDQLLSEFLQDYYVQRYYEYDQDIQALDFGLTTSKIPWTLANTISYLISGMTLTGSNSMLCSTLICEFLSFGIAIIGCFIFVIILASSSTVIVHGIKLCFQRLLLQKSKQKSFNKVEALFRLGADFGTLVVVMVLCGGSIVLGALAMKKDQPVWSFQEALMYTFAQGTTLGGTQLVPNRVAMGAQNLRSIFFYTSIRLFAMFWITCFVSALINLGKSLDRITRSGLTSSDLEDVLRVDRLLMQSKGYKFMD